MLTPNYMGPQQLFAVFKGISSGRGGMSLVRDASISDMYYCAQCLGIWTQTIMLVWQSLTYGAIAPV